MQLPSLGSPGAQLKSIAAPAPSVVSPFSAPTALQSPDLQGTVRLHQQDSIPSQGKNTLQGELQSILPGLSIVASSLATVATESARCLGRYSVQSQCIGFLEFLASAVQTGRETARHQLPQGSQVDLLLRAQV